MVTVTGGDIILMTVMLQPIPAVHVRLRHHMNDIHDVIIEGPAENTELAALQEQYEIYRPIFFFILVPILPQFSLNPRQSL